MEEERRLWYVAFTRAKKKLVLTHARQRMLFGRTTANRVSRFLEESELVSGREETSRRTGNSWGDSWNDSWSNSDSWGGSRDSYNSYGYRGSARNESRITDFPQMGSSGKPERKTAFPVRKKEAPAQDTPPVSSLSLSVGQTVSHKAFGKGIIVKMTPMGGDHLVEIQFDSVGSKKLMLKAASRYLQPE